MSITASIRRAILIDEARGHIVQDENANLDDLPEILAEPGEEDVFLHFLDGFGWDSGINAYEGYGSKFIWTNNGSPPKSLIGQNIDNANEGDVPVFNEDTGLYEPGKAAIVGGDEGPEDGQVLAWDDDEGKYIPVDATAAQFEEDSITVVIEQPTNRVYPVVVDLVTNIEITGGNYNFETGPGSALLPSGNFSAGAALNIVVSGTNSSSSFLVAQINYRKPLNA